MNLAARRLGAMVLEANDEWFAEKENLLNDHAPEWRADAYTARGKWMDGWETRRRRSPGHDWCVVRLGVPGHIRKVVVDTAFFTGNYPEECSLEGTADGENWDEILPRSPLKGDFANAFEVDSPWWVTHVRLRIFPDGGVARLRVFGDPLPILRGDEPNLAAQVDGADVVACSDEFYGSSARMLQDGDALNMGDGWENRRRRDDGNDWAVVRLAAPGTLTRAVVDTRHFLGNCPGHVALSASRDNQIWTPLLARTPLQPHWVHHFDLSETAASFVRIDIYPDGGVARLRLFGHLADSTRDELGVERLNRLAPATARARLADCCGSSSWVEQMLKRRPFSDATELRYAHDSIFGTLGDDDLREALASHPEIGARADAGDQSSHGEAWSSKEQAGMAAADQATRDEIAALNRKYRERFGYIYVVRAAGRSATELRDILKERLSHSPDAELPVAAEQQREITHLRLDKLLRGVP